jgi:hypothetical protein
MAEKRKNKRFARRLVVRFGEADLSRMGFASDISTSGVFVMCDVLPPIGARLHLQIELNPAKSVYAEAVVRRHKLVPPKFRSIDKSGFGVRLLDPAELVGEVVPQLRADALAAADQRFSVSFANLDALRTAFERELRHGGVFLRTDRVLERDSAATVQIEIAYAGKRLEFPARVVQVAEGAVRGLGFVFEDRAALSLALAPYL